MLVFSLLTKPTGSCKVKEKLIIKKLILLLILAIGMTRIAAAQQPLTLTVVKGDDATEVKGVPASCYLTNFSVEKGKSNPTYYALIQPPEASDAKGNIIYDKFRLFAGKFGSAMSEITGIKIKYEDHEFTIKSADVELNLSPYHGTEVKNYVTVDLDIIPHQ